MFRTLLKTPLSCCWNFFRHWNWDTHLATIELEIYRRFGIISHLICERPFTLGVRSEEFLQTFAAQWVNTKRRQDDCEFMWMENLFFIRCAIYLAPLTESFTLKAGTRSFLPRIFVDGSIDWTLLIICAIFRSIMPRKSFALLSDTRLFLPSM